MTALLMQHMQCMLKMHNGIPVDYEIHYTLTYNIMRKELHNHWITVSTMGLNLSHIRIYDSFYTSLSEFTKYQICDY